MTGRSIMAALGYVNAPPPAISPRPFCISVNLSVSTRVDVQVGGLSPYGVSDGEVTSPDVLQASKNTAFNYYIFQYIGNMETWRKNSLLVKNSFLKLKR
ncbi:hypothetical protein ElyMa_000459100 [Elysia marginata]|uniref:Uncharacterized protein n=1 Tax=Elysia marginata TaxID=1093978 RepID=A0AAV4FQ61_9GAST|nr:hypothetical protein ElyMa_000459100 [Elysia marginata]